MYMYGRATGLAWLLTLGGIGLAWSCLLGIVRREEVYDAESASMMFWSQLLGIVIGLGLCAWGVSLLTLLQAADF